MGATADAIVVSSDNATPVDIATGAGGLNDLESILINESIGNNVQIELFVATA